MGAVVLVPIAAKAVAAVAAAAAAVVTDGLLDEAAKKAHQALQSAPATKPEVCQACAANEKHRTDEEIRENFQKNEQEFKDLKQREADLKERKKEAEESSPGERYGNTADKNQRVKGLEQQIQELQTEFDRVGKERAELDTEWHDPERPDNKLKKILKNNTFLPE
jgi:chromosome segregation ATPase